LDLSQDVPFAEASGVRASDEGGVRGTCEQTALRIRSVLEAGGELSGEQRRLLFGFLHEGTLPEDVSQAQWIEFKNKAWNRLRNDPGSFGFVENAALAVLEDAGQPEVLRNYALQHLGAWVLDGHATPRAVARIRQALEEVDNSIAGTALISLAEAARMARGVSQDEVSQAALSIARNPRVSEASLISALQILGEVQSSRGRTVALALAGDATRSVSVRVAALAAAGVSPHSREGERWVRTWDVQPDERLRIAARRLLRREKDGESGK
jgi:hypothetical protein